MKNILSITCLPLAIFGLTQTAYAAKQIDSLLDAINDPNRNPSYTKRDMYRNPYETLSFFIGKSKLFI